MTWKLCQKEVFPRLKIWGFVKMLLSRRSYNAEIFCVLVDNSLVRSLLTSHSELLSLLFIYQKSLIGFAEISPIISTQQDPSDDFTACKK